MGTVTIQRKLRVMHDACDMHDAYVCICVRVRGWYLIILIDTSLYNNSISHAFWAAVVTSNLYGYRQYSAIFSKSHAARCTLHAARCLDTTTSHIMPSFIGG